MIKKIRDYFIVLGLALLMAVNYEVFILQNAFAPAGLNGIATMIQYKLDFSVGYMTLLINIPLCIWAFFWLDKDYAAKTMLFSLAFSLFLLVFKYGVVDISKYVYVTENGTSTLLAPITAGVINGFIYGIFFYKKSFFGKSYILRTFICTLLLFLIDFFVTPIALVDAGYF
ncbi:MAG: YitT family protein, partial [Clostridia bacterium]|nr:YitT family protein [Clostridia bacterium]